MAADVVLVDEDVESDDPEPSELAAAESEESPLEADPDALSCDDEPAAGAGSGAAAVGTAAATRTRVGPAAVRWTTTRWRRAATTADGTGPFPIAALMISAVASAEVAATVTNCDQLRRIARSREIMTR